MANGGHLPAGNIMFWLCPLRCTIKRRQSCYFHYILVCSLDNLYSSHQTRSLFVEVHTQTHKTTTLRGKIMSPRGPFVLVKYAFSTWTLWTFKPHHHPWSLAGWQAGRQGTQVWCWRYPAVRPPAQAWLLTASPCHPVSHGPCGSHSAAQGDGAADGQSQMIEATW